MKKLFHILLIVLCLTSCDENESYDGTQWQQPEVTKFYKGTTMTYADFLQDRGVIYQENGVAKDPYESVRDHGGNIIRLILNVDLPEVTSESIDYQLDMESWEVVKKQVKHAKDLGMDVLLTFHLASDNGERAPLSWMSKSQEEMAETVYSWIYEKLDYLGAQGILPEIIAVGNETNVTFCYYKSSSDPSFVEKEARKHATIMLNKGYEAIDAINAKYGTKAKKLLHIAGPESVEYCLSKYITDNGLDNFDVVGLSWYYGFNGQGMGNWQSFAHLAKWLWLKYRKQFLIMETSIGFTTENGDAMQQVGPTPTPGYELTPAGQRRWLEDLAQDVANGGGLGVIYWGGEWVANDVYTFPDFKGSTWDDKTFWDSTPGSDIHQLHEGIDWMKRDYLLK